MERLEIDRRTIKDRRERPTKPFSRYILSGHRQSVRRWTDRKTHLYVDRYGHRLLVALLLIVLFSVLDAYFTIFHVEKGAREINPFMSFLIDSGDIYFFAIKYILTALSIFLLCIYKNLLMVRVLIPFIVFIYVAVLAHHVSLIFLR